MQPEIKKQPILLIDDSLRLQPLVKPPSLRILVAPSGFKECLGPDEVADCIDEGLRRVLDSETSEIRKVPLHDGGEGFCKALVASQGGEIRELRVTGPIDKPVNSHFGLLGDDKKTAVLDMASAAGLGLVPRDCRDPTRTTTYGVGELIKAALDEGCGKIIIGCGDSGTSDGGAGMLQALGAKLLDKHGNELPLKHGGGSLTELASICLNDLHPRLREQGDKVQIEAVCNIKNMLCGPEGVARVYGPQKAATPDQVDQLSLALEQLAKAARPIVNDDLTTKAGAGASGGLGAGLLILGAKLRPRSDAIDEYFQLSDTLQERWDVVVTAEGSLDHQSARGKMTVDVARRARRRGAQVVVLAGTIGDGADAVYDAGVCAFSSILDGPLTLEEAIRDCPRLLRNAAEKSMRMVRMGMALTLPAPAVVSVAKSGQKGVVSVISNVAGAV